MVTIGKEELIKSLRANESLGLETKAQAERITNAVIEFVRQALLNGDNVRLANLGTFKVATSKERSGKAMGHEYSVPERKTAKFAASTVLKKELNA
jgi:nucleoid DNA-binding protein